MERGRPIEYMSPADAVDYAATEFKIFISVPTVTKWAADFKFGHQLGGTGESKKGGKWVINKTKFRNYLNGQSND